MKRIISLGMSLILSSLLLSGCQNRIDPVFTAKNNIFTYERINPEQTQIIVSRTGNIGFEGLIESFEQQNPDVQVIVVDITGGNGETKPVSDWVINGNIPDVMISAGQFMEDQYVKQYFENLSVSPVIDNFETAALNRIAIDGDIYLLPGPSDVSCMIYNKTMFDKYGWKVPNTFDEFVKLCIQIREDTNGEVQPWNPNAKYSNEFMTAIEAMCYEEVFGGVDNYAWYDQFINEKATFKGHMEPLYNLIQTLIDNEILKEEHFSYSATTRGEEFNEGKIAMINMLASDYDSEAFDFSFMPFPTTKGEMGYLCDSFSSVLGVPIKERSRLQQDAVDRFVTYFATPEGQKAYTGDTLKVSNVKGTTENQNADMASLQPVIQEGHMFARIEFENADAKNRAVDFSICENALEMITGDKTAEDCISAVDAKPYKVSGEQVQSEIVAEAAEDFSILETSFYIADLYREKTGADIALITNNVAFRGNLMRIFAGPLTTSNVNTLKPRSFDNESTLIKVTMTGQQLLDALNAPPDYDEGIADCIYAYSGLKCKVAPWNEFGQKYLSVELADGSPLDPAKEYSVAIWSGTVGEQYITSVDESYEGSFEELLIERLKKDQTIVPVKDKRIKLVWK